MKLFSFIPIFVMAAGCAQKQPGPVTDYNALFGSTDGTVQATGWDSHVELRWGAVPESDHYRVYMQRGGQQALRGETAWCYLLDFVNDLPQDSSFTYVVAAFDSNGKEVSRTGPVQVQTHRLDDAGLQQMVQYYTFRYVWDFADPLTGLALERSNDTRPNCVTTGGSGFGVMGLIAGVERGFISREQAVGRLGKIVHSLSRLLRFHGAWAHWYDSHTGKPYHFSQYDNGGDLVETAFLMQGLMAAGEYFRTDDPALHRRIDSLWRGVEWDYYTQGENALYWHWSPDYGFKMNHKIKGYDETLITYILAAASPTHPIAKTVYDSCWVNPKPGEFFCDTTFYGIPLRLGKRAQMGGPLFWVHYSYLGLDPRGLSDRYADYWEQNRNYTLIDRAWCIANPHGWEGYGPGFWGLTASDALPSGYGAHSPGENDRGTVAPTAALSSMPYTPEESMEVLKNLYRNHGRQAFGAMGFYDGLRFTGGQLQNTGSYLAIDQGPILVMLENHRSAAVWNAFMRHPDVRRGLDKLGFTYKNN